MTFPTKPITALLVLTCLLAACSSPSKRRADWFGSIEPVSPKRGEPINFVTLARYFEQESTNLLQQGKVGAGFFSQPLQATCNLKLTPPSAQPLAPAEFAESVEMSVAVVGRIATINGKPALTPTAAGFFLTESGALATCWHVVNSDKITGLTVMTREGRVYPVISILAADTNSDVAILQVDGQGFRPLPVAPAVRQGAPIWVLSHPFPWYYMLTTGIVSGSYIATDRQQEVSVLNITADFANGSSGGPVLNVYGAVVGIARFRQNIGLPNTAQMTIKGCVPSSALLKLIQPLSPDHATK